MLTVIISFIVTSKQTFLPQLASSKVYTTVFGASRVAMIQSSGLGSCL